MKKLRLITLFSGYDSQKKALDYIGVETEHWKTCEWAVKSIQALKDLHFTDDTTDYSSNLTKQDLIDYLTAKGISSNYNEPMTEAQVTRLGETKLRQIYNNIKATHNLVNIQQVKGSDLEIVDTDIYDYLVTYSFPCQDLSLAGKGLGMEKGAGTRSGMLWEVERILNELYENGNNLPKYLMMENVPQVHGTKNKEHFDKWLEFLDSIGYKNFWQDLNAKDYSVPQNRKRTFMISILDSNATFKFPEPFELKLRLKDVLEKKVDEKYYLSDNIVAKLPCKITNSDSWCGIDLCDTKSQEREIANTIKSRYDCGYEHFSPGPTGVIEKSGSGIINLGKASTENQGNGFNSIYSEEGNSPTLLARDYKDPVRVCTEIKQVAQIYPNSGNPQAGRVYDQDGLSPCLDTCTGGNRMPKVVDDE